MIEIQIFYSLYRSSIRYSSSRFRRFSELTFDSDEPCLLSSDSPPAPVPVRLNRGGDSESMLAADSDDDAQSDCESIKFR